ncbi:MAG: SUMF1/EgtB/PvdO family nonheme iron enzyme, partial [Terracidiphilus sp.]
YRKDFSNKDERDIAVYLDGEHALCWWHRNVARCQYSIQGWQRERIYPDLIFAMRPNSTAGTARSRLVVLEMKGDFLAGNVWQWTSDWYRPDYYQQLVALGVARNPQGPDSAYDPSEPGHKKKTQRGGSFLCTDQYCSRYMVGTRGKGDVDTGTNHLGFRCVMTPQMSEIAQKESEIHTTQ